MADHKTVLVKQAFFTGWRGFTDHFWFFMGLAVIYLIINFIPSFTWSLAERWGYIDSFMDIILILFVTSLVLFSQIILSMGIIRLGLTIADGHKPNFSQLIQDTKKIWRFLGVNILVGLITAFGFMLFIIPGIYFSLKYQFAQYLVIDQNLGVVAALKRSGIITGGFKWPLFLLITIVAGLAFFGVMSFGLGLIIVVPVSTVAMAFIYRHLQNASSAPATLAPPPAPSAHL